MSSEGHSTIAGVPKRMNARKGSRERIHAARVRQLQEPGTRHADEIWRRGAAAGLAWEGLGRPGDFGKAWEDLAKSGKVYILERPGNIGTRGRGGGAGETWEGLKRPGESGET
eukprot:363933-Chlamydomonas_euryale.AAC.4